MTMRYFRVGDGRTLHLPPGLVEGTAGLRASARDVDHARWSADGKSRTYERGIHPHVVSLEQRRIDGAFGGMSFARFVAIAKRNGDLVEITEAEYAAELATPAPAPAPISTPAIAPAASLPNTPAAGAVPIAPKKETP